MVTEQSAWNSMALNAVTSERLSLARMLPLLTVPLASLMPWLYSLAKP
jgi:hypothetical protein